MLKTKGQVIPVTFDKTNVCVQYKSGKIIKGEGNIEDNINESSPIEQAFLDPKAKPNQQAL